MNRPVPREGTPRRGFSAVLSALLQRRLIVLRGGEKTRCVFSACLLYCIAALLLAPHLVLLSALLIWILRYRVVIRRDARAATPEAVEAFVRRTADGARRAGDAICSRLAGDAPQGRDRRDSDADFERDYDE